MALLVATDHIILFVVNVFLRLLKGVDFVVAVFVVFVLVVVVIVNVVVVAVVLLVTLCLVVVNKC